MQSCLLIFSKNGAVWEKNTNNNNNNNGDEPKPSDNVNVKQTEGNICE